MESSSDSKSKNLNDLFAFYLGEFNPPFANEFLDNLSLSLSLSRTHTHLTLRTVESHHFADKRTNSRSRCEPFLVPFRSRETLPVKMLFSFSGFGQASAEAGCENVLCCCNVYWPFWFHRFRTSTRVLRFIHLRRGNSKTKSMAASNNRFATTKTPSITFLLIRRSSVVPEISWLIVSRY